MLNNLQQCHLKLFQKEQLKETQRTTEAIAGLNGNKIAEKINKILNRFTTKQFRDS